MDRSVNEYGQIVGSAYATGFGTAGFSGQRALRWESLLTPPTVLEYLTADGDPLSRNLAADINDQGDIVGRAFRFVSDGPTLSQALLWDREGSAYWLDDLLVDAPGYQIENASEINNQGWIAAFGRDPSGVSRPVVLIPIPEPGLVVCIAGVGVCLIGRRDR